MDREGRILDENGRKVFTALVRLKALGDPIRQSDVAREAGLGERTLVTCRANSALLAGLIDEAMAFCLDAHLLKTAGRLQAEGGPVTYERIATMAGVATATLRRRRTENPGLHQALGDILSRSHPSDLRILAAVERLKAHPTPCAYAEVAREADVDPATLTARMYGNAKLRDAVNSIVRSTDSRILRAIENLLCEGAEVDQKAVAARAELSPATVTNRKHGNAAIRDALDQAVVLTDARILAAVAALKASDEEITQVRIARESGVAEGTVSARKEKNPRVREAVDEAVAHSQYRLVTAAVGRLNEEGAPITQRAIAERLGISEAAVVYRKEHNRDIFELVEAALPLSAVERIRRAEEDLLAEDIPCTQRNLSLRARLDRSTISRVLVRNPALGERVVAAPSRLPVFITVESCREALATRIRVYGNEVCNTAPALRRPTLRGGNPALLRACRRLEIALPVPRTDRALRMINGRAVPAEFNPLASYLERIGASRALLEEEAVALWNQARAGDRDAQDELLVRVRPMVKFVIEESLHEELNPFSFKIELLWQLIAEGDLILSSAFDRWEGKGGLLWFLHRQLQDGLAGARLAFFRERKRRARQEISISEPLGRVSSGDNADAFTLDQTREMEATSLSPDQALGILTEVSAFDEETLVAKRDADSGVPVVSRHDKQALAAALRPVFLSLDLGRVLESGLGVSWAAFMVAALGRMGTAVINDCRLDVIILTDTTAAFLGLAAATVAERLCAEPERTPGDPRGLVMGRCAHYDRIMGLVRGDDRKWSILRHLVTQIQRFGVGLRRDEGMARIAWVPVDRDVADGMRFEVMKNGILIAASDDRARLRLVRRVMEPLLAQSPEDAGRALLDAQVSFLRDQRARLEWVKRKARRLPAATQVPGVGPGLTPPAARR